MLGVTSMMLLHFKFTETLFFLHHLLIHSVPDVSVSYRSPVVDPVDRRSFFGKNLGNEKHGLPWLFRVFWGGDEILPSFIGII